MNIQLDGTKTADHLHAGCREDTPKEKTSETPIPRVDYLKPDFDILYEDKDCIVVNKPAGVLTASDESGDITLLQLVRAYHSSKLDPGKKGYLVPIHFLDRPVSGVIMFAKSSKAASRLNEQMRNRKIDKTYLAIVENTPHPLQAIIHDHLSKDRESNTTKVSDGRDTEAKASSLQYTVIASHKGLSLLQLQPLTGRSHQIRVQLASRGWPIYGDVKYKSQFTFKRNIALHAWRLKFSHPINKTTIEVMAPPPSHWQGVFDINSALKKLKALAQTNASSDISQEATP